MPHTAKYNQDNDKLYLFPEDRLSEEEYGRVTAAGLRWWRGHRAFVGNWTPEREDLVLEFAPIATVDEPDDPQARTARFQGRARRAQGRADERRGAMRLILGSIPLGQPILRDHPSAKRHRRDLERVEGHEKALRAELGKVDHYARRVEGAERRGRQQQDPAVLSRRVRELEAEHRKCQRRAALGGSDQAHAQRWVAHLAQRLTHERARLARLTGETGQPVHVAADFTPGELVQTIRGRASVVKVASKKVRVRLLEGESPHLPGTFREWLEAPERLRKVAAPVEAA